MYYLLAVVHWDTVDAGHCLALGDMMRSKSVQPMVMGYEVFDLLKLDFLLV